MELRTMKILLCSAIMLAGLGLTTGVAQAQNPTPAPCGDACEKVCQPVQEMKKVVKRVYSCDYEDFCLPKCRCFGSLFGKSDCDCGVECGRVRTKKFLVVKLPKHEECVTTCVPKPAGCCTTGH